MQIQKHLTTKLGIEHPIVQAPMILQKPLAPLAAAVSNAGGLGSLGCAEMSIDELEQNIATLRKATDGPFNLNFFLHEAPSFDADLDAQIRLMVRPYYQKLGLDLPENGGDDGLEPFDADRLELLRSERPAMVSFHFGCPASEIVDELKSAGITTAATATTVNEALALQKAGIDVVVAQGWEAGGHRGAFETTFEDTGIGTMALVPQVVDAVDVPVLAAGGIGDGRGIAAAMALGAAGVWMGTAFLACTEAPISAIHRQTLLTATDEDTHLSRAFSGRPCRARKTPYSVGMAEGRPNMPGFPLMYNYSSPLKRHGIENDDLDYQFLLYGQSAALNQNVTAAALVARLVSESRDVLLKLGVQH